MKGGLKGGVRTRALSFLKKLNVSLESKFSKGIVERVAKHFIAKSLGLKSTDICIDHLSLLHKDGSNVECRIAVSVSVSEEDFAKIANRIVEA